MSELRVTGRSEDGTHLLLTDHEDNEFTHFGFLLRNVHPPLSGGASLKTCIHKFILFTTP